jgi:hypothetical protein
MEEEPLKLFISHPWRGKHREHTKRLIEMLDSAGFQYRNTAVRSLSRIKSQNKRYLRTRIRGRLKAADAILFVAGPWVSKSTWMQFEIDEAMKLGKPIVAIRRHGIEGKTYEETELGIETVGWRTEAIVSRLRGKINTHTEAALARLDKMAVEPLLPRPTPTIWSKLFGTRH